MLGSNEPVEKYSLAKISIVLSAKVLHISRTCMIAWSSLGMNSIISSISFTGRCGSSTAIADESGKEVVVCGG